MLKKEEEAPGNRDSEELQDQKAAAVVLAVVADRNSPCRPSECDPDKGERELEPSFLGRIASMVINH